MKRLKHRLFDSSPFRIAVSHVIAAYVRLVLVTSKKQFVFAEGVDAFLSGEKQSILAFWHGRLLMMAPMNPRKRQMNVLISQHRDGLLMSDAMKRFSIHTVAGSSSRGSFGALRNIFRVVKKGENIALTPDGPRGPFQVAAVGVAHIAISCGVPVLPTAYSATRHKRMKSWDRFMVALPFSTLYFVIGAPINAETKDSEILRIQIEQSLNEITEHADRLAGIIPS